MKTNYLRRGAIKIKNIFNGAAKGYVLVSILKVNKGVGNKGIRGYGCNSFIEVLYFYCVWQDIFA